MTHTTARLWIAAALLGFSWGAALAQSANLENFESGKDNLCPDEKAIIDAIRNGGRSRGQGLGFTFVSRPGSEVRAFQNAARTALAATGENPGFGTKVVVYHRSRGADQAVEGRVLAAYGENLSRCAWFSEGSLLQAETRRGREELRDGPQPMTAGEINDELKGSTLTAKAVLNNLQVEGESGVKFYADPQADDPVHTEQQFEFFTIFAVKDGKPRGDGQKNRHYLLGKFAESAATELSGWVHVDDAYQWPHRMAVEWNGSGLGGGWDNPDDIGKKETLRLKPEQYKGNYLDQIEGFHRNPVTSMSPDAGTVHTAAQEREKESGTLPMLERAPNWCATIALPFPWKRGARRRVSTASAIAGSKVKKAIIRGASTPCATSTSCFSSTAPNRWEPISPARRTRSTPSSPASTGVLEAAMARTARRICRSGWRLSATVTTPAQQPAKTAWNGAGS